MIQPAISVLLPVYNAEPFLAEAIESILRQSHSDFEFIIINDGSTDQSLEIASIYAAKDKRIILISRENKGLIRTLNEGLELAKGKYIARMDADDISHPERIQKQLYFMEKNPDIIVSGTALSILGDNNKVWVPPIGNVRIRANHIFASSIFHPTAIIRIASIREYNLKYDETKVDAEDYDLWVRASQYGKLGNISDVLLQYRRHEGAVGVKKIDSQRKCANKIRGQLLLNHFTCNISDEEIEIHNLICNRNIYELKDKINAAILWLEKLKSCNYENKYCLSGTLNTVITKYRLWLLSNSPNILKRSIAKTERFLRRNLSSFSY